MIDIKQLKCFITCADAGSFSEAASVLYTTQSSASKVIRALEEEMQASLFVRNPHGISLTQNLEYGQSKIEYLKTPHGAYDRNMEMIYLL